VHSTLAGSGTVHTLLDVRHLLSELASPHDECLVLDPALLTPSVVETIATRLTEYPRDVVAFSSVTTAALESAVILAQRTSARFVFRGTPNEKAALERALLLTPDAALRSAVLALIEPNLERLPSGIRDRLVSMFRTGDGPHSPDALAAATAVTRRSMDRYLSDAGFPSTRLLVEAAHITSGYRAITGSQIPLRNIAAMLGYSGQRTMDAQLKVLLGVTSAALRAHPLTCDEAARRITLQLTGRETRRRRTVDVPRAATASGTEAHLKLIRGDSPVAHVRRKASGETVIHS
jgi:hypothetical protein